MDQAIAFLRSQNYAHSDIKPENIVVQSQNRPFDKLYLIDFGNATYCPPGIKNIGFEETEGGTEDWTAPEVYETSFWEPNAADVWAMGAVLQYFAKWPSLHDPFIRKYLDDDPEMRSSAQTVCNTVMQTPMNKKRPRDDSDVEHEREGVSSKQARG
ncbi:hypothetical protein FRB94_013880 [Tulasnella sp. JGI-2019a]|nr:hypothetical protein FRB94_013880 [Tulasnella sp. JGI-2019a]